MARCQSDKRIRIFPCFIPDKDVQLYMNAADAVVLPFQDVLTSGSALLAMSFGKALILPRRGSLTEIVDNQGGLFYDPKEKAGMYKALQQALTADFSTMGKHNYEEVKRFSWDKIAQKTYEVYSQCRS
jgi:glycosyltransferase involved in cell wall biosynthesis